MRSLKTVSALIMAVILAGIATACGSADTTAGGAAGTEAYSVEQTAAAAKAGASADELIGTWKDYDDQEQSAKISKVGSDYQYEDNDGKYPATFADGVLKVKISDEESGTANVYIDPETGHMLMVYQGSLFEFIKA